MTWAAVADERTVSRYAHVMPSAPPIQAVREDAPEYDGTAVA